MDHEKEHLRKSVLWDVSTGSAVTKQSDEYLGATSKFRQHTDFARENGLMKSIIAMQRNNLVRSSKSQALDNWAISHNNIVPDFSGGDHVHENLANHLTSTLGEKVDLINYLGVHLVLMLLSLITGILLKLHQNFKSSFSNRYTTSIYLMSKLYVM